ncbi:MAG: hypothetical protein OER21_04595 [Gemmatimonadota bacterium]|nr:hypothetical protein [Gemmatimonadota bacterium]
MRPPFGLAALTLALVAVRAPAQEGIVPLDSATVATLAPLESRIGRAAQLRLRTATGSVVLLAPRLRPSGLGYRAREGPDPRLDGRGFLLQAKGRATWTGAAVGAVVAGLGSALLFSQLAGLACLDGPATCRAPRLESAVIGGLMGGAGGGLVGGLIGALIPRWHTIYRHPPP